MTERLIFKPYLLIFYLLLTIYFENLNCFNYARRNKRSKFPLQNRTETKFRILMGK